MATPRGMPLKERVLANVEFEPNSGCWIWLLTLTQGYGRICVTHPDGREQNAFAHRVSYQEFVGPIPPELEIDHKCRMRCCVNPDHLETVTRQVNMLRGETFAARNAAKTNCPKGHPYAGRNLRIGTAGRRFCRKCGAEWMLARSLKPRRKFWTAEHATAARLMVAAGLTQTEIAKQLGFAQSSISQFLRRGG